MEHSAQDCRQRHNLGLSKGTAGSRPWHLVAWLAVCLLLASGCSMNALVLRYSYTQFDNRLKQQLLEYASFDSGQRETINQSVDDFVAWHRASELPRYATLIDQFADALQNETLDQPRVLLWLQQLRTTADQLYQRSPVRQSPQFLLSLSDPQVAEIAASFSEQDAQYKRRQAEWGQKTADQKLSGPIKGIERLGITLRPDQRAIVAAGLQRYQWNAPRRRQLWKQWEAQLIALLQQRQQADFLTRVTEHLEQYQLLARLDDPVADAFNQQNTAQLVIQLDQSLTDAQRRSMVQRLQTVSQTLRNMAQS